MNIIHLSPTPMAQVPYRYCQLINKYTKHKAFYFQAKAFYLGRQSSIEHSNMRRILDVIQTADIVHIHGHRTYDTRKWVGISYNLNRNTKIFLEYHGLPERGCPRFKRNVHTIVSTPEMLATFTEAVFFPALLDEKEIYRKQIINPPPPLKICQGWTFHKKVKDTNFFETIISKNNKSCQGILLSQMTGDAFIKELQKYHAIFDHMQGYYGVVSLEGLALGMLVFNGASKHTLEQIKNVLESNTYPPFVLVDRCTFEKRLTVLAKNNSEYETITRLGRVYVEEFWNGLQINKLINLYINDSAFTVLHQKQQSILKRFLKI